jgi:uncharacterized protein YndB with AHSA1/START domain
MTTAPFTTSRIFNAPLALVWDVHTTPAHQARWLSPGDPQGYQSTMDFREGGTHFYGMAGPDGSVMYGKQTFLQILPLKRVVLIQSFADKDGNVAPHPMAPTWPREMLSTNEYEDLGNGTTRLTVTWAPHQSSEVEEATFDSARGGMQGGWDHQFDQIATYLASL